MALSPRLELRQGQALVMTPQLQQAIKLLQLSNLELAEFIEAELERNPLLDRAESLSADDPDLLDAVKRLTDRHAEAVEALGLEADLIPSEGRRPAGRGRRRFGCRRRGHEPGLVRGRPGGGRRRGGLVQGGVG